MNEEEMLRSVMSRLGQSRSEKKLAALETARHHAATKRRAEGLSEEHKAKMKEAQQARRERERAERLTLEAVNPPAPKRPQGRPKKQTTFDLLPVPSFGS